LRRSSFNASAYRDLKNVNHPRTPSGYESKMCEVGMFGRPGCRDAMREP
jgi:hypothetical protein